MTSIMLELRNVADSVTGHQRGAWATSGGTTDVPEIADLHLEAGRLAVGSVPGATPE